TSHRSLRGEVRGQFISERLMLVAHGWNVDYSVFSTVFSFQYCPSGRGTNEGSGEGPGTLLGV
ncbi:hypothetical protein, partial [Streptomyces sp. NPDC057052]|uniref:hypothetical protein n=1 Tax=Streptomyces sp. NPDC057052 TaxID=3346010 RepID=UPI00363617F4